MRSGVGQRLSIFYIINLSKAPGTRAIYVLHPADPLSVKCDFFKSWAFTSRYTS
jgi:hypothetical protein